MPFRACLISIAMAALSFVPVLAATHVVLPDGTGDFPTIQDAVDAATDGDVIELGDGTFTGEGNRNIEYLGKAITIKSQSGDPESCIIDAQGIEGESRRGFSFKVGDVPAARLESVKIINGRTHTGEGDG